MADARRGLFHVVCVWKFDSFARSAHHLLSALDEFRRLNIEFVSVRAGGAGAPRPPARTAAAPRSMST